MRSKKIPNTHPGEFLKEEFLEPLNISTYRLAKDIGVSAIRISEIIRGKRSITADTAIRLEKYFGMSAEFWMKWQAHYDLEEAKDRKDTVGKEIKPYTPAGGSAGSADLSLGGELSRGGASLGGKAVKEKALKPTTKHPLRKIALHR